MRMRTRIAAALMLAALAPAGGNAGTAADPEISDVAGDVQWIPDGDLSHMDLRAAWFESVRNDAGALEAVRLTIRTEAARPADQPFALAASWTIMDGQVPCTTDLHIADDAATIGVVEWTAQAWVYSWCEGDSNAITLGPLSVVVLGEGRAASFVRDGVDYVATIPLSSFEGTRADGLYVEGATLQRTIVNTFKVLPSVWIGVDHNEEAAPFTLGA